MKGGLRTKSIEKINLPQQPLVSIITVVLNGEKHLEETIKSVISQSYKNVEYIIIDGGSTDETHRIINQYEDYIDYWQSEKDGGIFFAMNKGIALAKGDLIGILNADDYYEKNAVDCMVAFYLTHGEGIYCGDMRVLGSHEFVLRPDISALLQRPSIPHPACFVTKGIYEKAGLFNTAFKISSDYEFLLRCYRMKFIFHHVLALITNFRPGGMSASCASNMEGYRIMKMHQTGHHTAVLYRGIKCYLKTFLKKLIPLRKA